MVVDPIVAFITGFQGGVGAHVIGIRINVLTRCDGGNHLRWPMAKPAIDDLDRRAVEGFECVSRVEMGGSADKLCLPVGPQIEDFAFKVRARNGSADDGNDAAATLIRES